MRRSLGLLGILVGSILPPLAVGASPWRSCDGCRGHDRERGLGCFGPQLLVLPIPEWAPAVDPRAPGEPVTCLPVGESGGGRALVESAKPRGYNPLSSSDPLQACLLVSREGAVEAVRLGTSLNPSRGAVVADSMRAWRFAPVAASTSTWVRVRLTTRYGAAAASPSAGAP
jgi:hypothetical protein